MLTCPDRHRFQQLRAQWERAQFVSDNPSNIVGGEDKGAGKQSPKTNSPGERVSRIRRKFSYGLSLISNPLGQRKVTRDRDPGSAEGSKDASSHLNAEGQGGDESGLFSRASTSASASSSHPLLASSSGSNTSAKAKVGSLIQT